MPPGTTSESIERTCRACGLRYKTTAPNTRYCKRDECVENRNKSKKQVKWAHEQKRNVRSPIVRRDTNAARNERRRAAREQPAKLRAIENGYQGEMERVLGLLGKFEPGKLAFRRAMELVAGGRDPHYAYCHLAALCIEAAAQYRPLPNGAGGATLKPDPSTEGDAA